MLTLPFCCLSSMICGLAKAPETQISFTRQLSCSGSLMVLQSLIVHELVCGSLLGLRGKGLKSYKISVQNLTKCPRCVRHVVSSLEDWFVRKSNWEGKTSARLWSNNGNNSSPNWLRIGFWRLRIQISWVEDLHLPVLRFCRCFYSTTLPCRQAGKSCALESISPAIE